MGKAKKKMKVVFEHWFAISASDRLDSFSAYNVQWSTISLPQVVLGVVGWLSQPLNAVEGETQAAGSNRLVSGCPGLHGFAALMALPTDSRQTHIKLSAGGGQPILSSPNK